ncbi:MAG TPA: RNA methyltransferase [Opitutaceae bacterium]|nr:RNA methyltransferase [Opitutaceae bacterium]
MITRAEIRLLRSLRDKKHREELGLFAVEGEKIVAELLAAGHPFERIYGTGAWTGRKTHEIAEPEMARASHFPTPSPVLAVGRIRREALAPGELDRGLTLALDGVQDPGNVGTMLRIADWFGLDRVILSPGCADLHSQKVIQASMGSFARVRAIVADLGAALSGIRAPIVGCALEGRDVHGMAGFADAVIVVGSEGRGLSEDVRGRLAYCVTIPRRGAAESLNAAVAAAIVCDNLRRNAPG